MLQVQVFAQVNRMPVSIEEIPGSGFQFVNTATHQPVNQTIWIEAEPFVNGYSRVMDNNGFGFVNGQGRLISEARFEATRNFSQGLAAVRKNNQWGFIRTSGILAIPCRYTIAYDFTSNITAVLQDKQWLLINTSGMVVARPDISICYGFQGSEARVSKNGREGVMNLSGVIRWTSDEIPAQRQAQPTVQSANGDCPDNIDFEFGNFQNWTCYTGRVDSVGNTNVITVNPSGPINNRHTIVPRTNPSAIDPYGLFPVNPPDGSNYAVRLGNTNIGAQAERIRYTINVPPNDSNFSIKYDYAVVFQDPGHSNWTQPRFQARLFDSAANRYIDCASFEYISTSSLPGFAVSTVDTSVIYKSWASVFISLRDYPGRTLFLEFTNADCVRRGHWGYAYVDVENTCRNNFNLQYNCGNPSTASISAPPGFQTYNWWNQNFSTLLATGQNVLLSPAPAMNSTVWVELIPYQDFGCRDTFPVRMTSTYSPTIHASAQQAVCAPHNIQFYNADAPSAGAHWDFGDGTTASGDSVSHTFQQAGTYIVTLNVQLSNGCSGISTDTVTILEPTASFNYTGGNFCNRRNVRFTAVTNLVDSLYWDFGDGTTLTTTQSTVSHTYAAPGVYIPTLTAISNSGCRIRVPGTDTIRIEEVLAGFQFDVQPRCGNAVLTVSDTSSSTFGIQAYNWNMGGGITASGPTATQTYNQSGSYNIQLIVTGAFGCRDTVTHPVPVVIYSYPVVSIVGPDSVCANAPATLSAQSADTIQLYEWTVAGNTTIGSNYSLNTSQPGVYLVQLVGESNHGCMDTTTHQVVVNSLPDVIRQASSTICHGSTSPVISLTGSMSGSVFQWTNDNPSIGLSASGTGNIPSFIANNISGVPVTANITVTPVANGCAGNASSFSITVNPLPFISLPDNQMLCNREASQPVIFNSFSGNVTYNWINTMPSIGLSSNGTGNIPSFNAVNNSDTVQVATVSITATDNGCSAAPVTFNITVKPSPVVVLNDITVCQGSTVPGLMPASNLAGTQFSWTNSQVAIGLAASGIGQIPSFTAQLPGTAPITSNVQVSSVASGCQGLPVNMTITVNPLPQVTQPANQSLCTGEMTSPVYFTGTQPAADYQWTNNQTSIGLMQQGTGDIPSFTTVNFGSSPVSATVTVIPMLAACTGTPVDFTFTVYPLANLVQPLNQFLCNGEATAPITFFGTTGGTTYSWTNDNTAIGLAASGSGNIPSFTAVNPSNTTVSANITVTAMANSCPGVSRTFKIFVDPTPGMAQPDNITVCSGSVVNPSGFAATVTGTTFSWINSASSIGLPASGNGDLPAFTAVNHTAFPITAVVSVTGFANSCASVSRVFTITVYPQPVVDSVTDQGICHGTATGAIGFTGNAGVTGFTWTNNQPSIGLAASGIGDIPSFTAINQGQTDLVAQIMVSASNPGCAGSPVPFNITVHPLPALQATADTRLCRGQSVQLSASNAAAYSWSPSQYLSCSDCANPLATPTGNISYIVEGTTAYGCRAKDTVSLNVIQRFNMQVSGPDTICVGGSAQLLASGAASYQWTPASSLNQADIANPVATPTATTRYRVVGYDANQCFTDTGYVTITVGNIPQVNIGPDMNVTAGTVLTLSPVVQNGPIVQWSWTPPSGLSCSDCQNPVLTVSQPTSYILTVQNTYGCFGSDTLVVNSFCKSSQVFVPNAFTPDGDGLNDILMVRGTGIRVKSFRIFNRWGNLVFEKLNFAPNDPGYGWNGKVNGVPASPDVFVYTAEVICDSGVIQTIKGNTTILK